MDQKLLKLLSEKEDLVVPTLFKPVQFGVIKKLNAGKKLNENEKRYLRGIMKKKLQILEMFANDKTTTNKYFSFLNDIGSYYITGLEAIKHNGFGWYYDTKIIEVINTKINGEIYINNKKINLIKLKSIKDKKIIIDAETGLKYATNRQVIKDIRHTKNSYAKTVCEEMLQRYGDLFAKKVAKFKDVIHQDYSAYGV